jgi:hypothetical protein
MNRLPKLLCCAALLLLSANAKANLIVNGDFEQGNTGFTTQYVYAPGGIGNSDTYAIVTDPHLVHSSASSYGDHTTGSGLMMVLNGNANDVAWSESVAVKSGATYDFSIWVSSWTGASPARLDFLFNGATIGNFTAPSTSAVWQQFTLTWNSDTNTSLTIQIIDRNDASDGNDFALDDISLDGPAPGAVPEPSSSILALMGGAALWGYAWRRRVK